MTYSPSDRFPTYIMLMYYATVSFSLINRINDKWMLSLFIISARIKLHCVYRQVAKSFAKIWIHNFITLKPQSHSRNLHCMSETLYIKSCTTEVKYLFKILRWKHIKICTNNIRNLSCTINKTIVLYCLLLREQSLQSKRIILSMFITPQINHPKLCMHTLTYSLWLTRIHAHTHKRY